MVLADWVLQAEERKVTGKGAVSRLRRQGRVPAVLYGKKVAGLPLQVPVKELLKVMQEAGEKAIIRLQVLDKADTQEYPVLIQEIQRDAITRNLQHIDFHQVSLEEKLVTEVPVVLVGEAAGTKQGGILQRGARSVVVECLPQSLPAELELDIDSLGLGDAATAADLPLPPGVRLVSDPATVLASLIVPRRVGEEEREDQPAGEEEP